MGDIDSAVHSKVLALFQAWAGNRAERLSGFRHSAEAQGALEQALVLDGHGEHAHDIAFHLCDWNWDAAFLVAMHLAPEDFTPEEVAAGVRGILCHMPNHVIAAAQLAGHPVSDVFDVGLRLGGEAG